MNHSEQINELAAALAKAQGDFPDIPRNRTVKVRLRDNKGEYEFKYATLDAILTAVRKPLSANGLSITCYMANDDKGEVCTTRLFHASGQWMECSFPLIVDGGADAQRWGSALTYAKRNGIAALLAIHADEDDDGNHACGNESKPLNESKPKNGNGKQQQNPTAPPPNGKTNGKATEPKDDDERLQRLYAFVDNHKDSAKLLAIITDTVGNKGVTLFNRMKTWQSVQKRQVGEMFLTSCLNDADKAAYLDFLIEQRKDNIDELKFLNLQIPKQQISQERMAALLDKIINYGDVLEQAAKQAV